MEGKETFWGGTRNGLCKGLEWLHENVGFSGNWKLLSMAVAQSLSERLEARRWEVAGEGRARLHRPS